MELKFLEELSNDKLKLPNFTHKIIYDEDAPMAKPDFFYERENLAIFIDGPPHERDYVQRDDETKRNKLRELGYRVFAIRYNKWAEDIEGFKKVFL